MIASKIYLDGCMEDLVINVYMPIDGGGFTPKGMGVPKNIITNINLRNL